MTAKSNVIGILHKDCIEEVVEEKLKKNKYKLLALQNVTCSVSGFESKSKKNGKPLHASVQRKFTSDIIFCSVFLHTFKMDTEVDDSTEICQV